VEWYVANLTTEAGFIFLDIRFPNIQNAGLASVQVSVLEKINC